MKNHFETIVLIARPAAGKSEVIDYLKKTDVDERRRCFHIGEFEEIDDFPYVWETFEIDDILAKHGRPRLWTDEKYYFTDEWVWNLYIERINLAYAKRLAANPNYHDDTTAIIEFARGGRNGFGEAFSYLSDDILSRAGIVYIKVSYEESVRKNRARARPGLEDSILYHSLPDDKMEYYYKDNDWDQVSAEDPRCITIRSHRVPYSVFDNEDDLTTGKPELLGAALEEVFARLWELRRKAV